VEGNDIHVDSRENTTESRPTDEYLHPKYQRFLICDFVEIFNDNNWAHFYIMTYSILTFVTLLLVAFLQNYAIPKFVVIAVLNIIFLAYVIYSKPFKSKWNNFKTMLLHIIIIAVLVCDLAIVGNPQYQYGLELAIVIVVCLMLILNIVLYVAQMIFAYYEEISEWMGLNVKKMLPEETEKIEKIEENHDQKIEAV